jgi:hypothetical protein
MCHVKCDNFVLVFHNEGMFRGIEQVFEFWRTNLSYRFNVLIV